MRANVRLSVYASKIVQPWLVASNVIPQYKFWGQKKYYSDFLPVAIVAKSIGLTLLPDL